MKSPNYNSNATNELNSRVLQFACAILAFSMASNVIAASEDITVPDSDVNTAYVDSVTQWGAWELDIEPAAGGLSAPTTQPLNARGTKLALRSNSISALAPPAPGGMVITQTPTPAPPLAPPPAPPMLMPISPNVPVPGSAPVDGF